MYTLINSLDRVGLLHLSVILQHAHNPKKHPYGIYDQSPFQHIDPDDH